MDDAAMVRLWSDDARRHRDAARLAQLIAVQTRENAARSTTRAEQQEQLWRIHTRAAEKLEEAARKTMAAAVQADGIAKRSEQAKRNGAVAHYEVK